MAVQFVASTFQDQGGSSNMVVNNIASTGDYVIATMCIRGSYTIASAHAGFTALDPPTIDGGGSTDPYVLSYGKVIASSDSTAFTFTRSSPTGRSVIGLNVFRDIDTDTPTAGGAESDVGTAASLTVPNSTCLADGSAALAFAGYFSSTGARTASAGSSWTESVDSQSAGGTLRAGLATYYSTAHSTGTVTGATITLSTDASAVTGIILIQPDASSNPAARYHYHSGHIQL
jgi:hypothetical protein